MSHFYLHDELFNKLVLAMNVTEITINHSHPVFVIQVLLLCAIFLMLMVPLLKKKYGLWKLHQSIISLLSLGLHLHPSGLLVSKVTPQNLL
jgi:hypothetical protein